MARVAVIGSGISGLGAAHLLSRAHEVTVLEKDTRLGGHTHTVEVATPDGPVAVDTGFIVHNRVTYPNFIRLMEELGVPTCGSDMSFAYHGRSTWCSRGLNGLFADRANLFRPAYHRFWQEVMRFNRVGRAWLVAGGDPAESLQAWLDARQFSADFREHYLLPMAGAVWSTPNRAMGAFPALALLRFFEHHGFLGVFTQHAWRTIPGGTSRYLEPLTRPFQSRIRTGVDLGAVTRVPGGVEVRVEGAEPERFDHVVFACHGDQVLPLLPEATPIEREVLSAFRSNVNTVALHRDTAILPPKRRAWASWNYREASPERMVLTYHMNRLQPLKTRTDLMVTLNADDLLDSAQVDRRLVYEHPRFDAAVTQAQGRWREISGVSGIHYCGAYWRYGFHEDGLWSGIRVARDLGISW